jgi:hypothetical protein
MLIIATAKSSSESYAAITGVIWMASGCMPMKIQAADGRGLSQDSERRSSSGPLPSTGRVREG